MEAAVIDGKLLVTEDLVELDVSSLREGPFTDGNGNVEENFCPANKVPAADENAMDVEVPFTAEEPVVSENNFVRNNHRVEEELEANMPMMRSQM